MTKEKNRGKVGEWMPLSVRLLCTAGELTLRFLLPISCMFMEHNPLNEITRAKVYIAEEPLISWYAF